MPNGTPASPPNDARLTLQTLGVWSLAHNQAGASLAPVFGASKPLALVVYLALSPNRSAGREHLVDLLWADMDPDAAAHALRQTIWFIRQRLGQEAIQSADRVVALTARLDIDRDAFVSAVESQDLEAAVALYHGDFLPGFAAPGGAEFERWADVERFRLRGLFLRSAEAMARRHLATGHLRDAIGLARRVRDCDPDSEAGWRLFLEALVAAGDDLSAAVEADQLERRLADDDREPEPATHNLLRLARQQPQTATAGAPAMLVAELVGREAEFGAIIAAWDAVRRGAARHIHLTSAAGLGKSRLLNDVHTRLRAGGARTVLLRATPGERGLTHAFASDLATALAGLPGAGALGPASAGTLVALAPPLAQRYPNAETDRATGRDAARRRLLVLAELVHAVCEEAPLALLVDDVHWADPDSRDLLNGLLSRVLMEPALIVSAARPVPEAILDRGDTQHFVLEPLTPTQVGAFVASLAQLPDEPWARDLATRVHASVHGSPLTLIETLHLAIERGTLTIDQQVWACPDEPALNCLLAEGAALRHRLEQLGRDQRWLLVLLAVHGKPLCIPALHDAAPRAVNTIDGDLSALEQRGLVTRQGDRWQVAHDAMGELAEEMAGAETIRAANLALGRSPSLHGGDAEQRRRAAQHAAAAGDDGTLLRLGAHAMRDARRAGDRRPPLEILAESLGAPGEDVLRRIRRVLPLHLRLGLGLRHAAAVAALTVVGTTLALWSGTLPEPDATLVVFSRDSGGTMRTQEIKVYRETWNPDRPITASGGRRIPWPFDQGIGQFPAGYLPAHGSWHVTASFPDEGGQDPVVFEDWGKWQRLDSASGDDLITSESPDGRYLLIQTARWSAQSRYNIGLYDSLSGSTIQLTAGNEADLGARWSHDGTRIAFVRMRFGSAREPGNFRLCTTDLLRRERCLPGQTQRVSLIAWRDSSHVITSNGAPERVLQVIDINTGVERALRPADTPRASPDGHWIASIGRPRPDGSTVWNLFPTDRPDLAAQVVLPPGRRGAALWKSPPERRYVVGLTGLAAVETVMVGVPYQPQILAVNADSSREIVRHLTWTSDDSTVLGIDSLGAVVARRTGHAVVTVSLGGWRTLRSSVVAVAPPGARTLLPERWEGDVDTRWRLYGLPRPQIVALPSGKRAFFNNGDGSNHSGAWTRIGFDARQGLGVEQLVQVPMDSGQWQSMVLTLTADLDTAAARTWNDSIDFPPGIGLGRGNCSVQVPWSEGSLPFGNAGVGSGQELWRLDDRAVIDGRWHRVRLQIFPDGRCGVAIDRRARWISETALPSRLPFFVMTFGNSMWTRILVGPLDVWSGVRTDVDWTRIESSLATTAPSTPRLASHPR